MDVGRLATGVFHCFIFATGTAGHFDTEIYWMRREAPPRSVELSTADVIALAPLESQHRTSSNGVLSASGRDVPELSVY